MGRRLQNQDGVKEQMTQCFATDCDGKNSKMGFQILDIIGQGTVSLTTIAAVVKQAEGDKYEAAVVCPWKRVE